MKIIYKEKIKEKLSQFLYWSNFSKFNRDVLLNHFDYMVNCNQKKEKVVYTCITGDYDGLQLHNYLNYDWDYVCFTDNKKLLNYKNYGAWKIRPLKFSELDSTKNSRWHKTHPHLIFPDYEESIWIDGNFNFASNAIFENIAQNVDCLPTHIHHYLTMAIPEHWRDDCIFKEIKNVRETKLEKPANIDKIENFLKENNMPEHYGLNETNCIYRKHNDNGIMKIMDEWWVMIRDFTKRDQLSLSYILFKNGLKPADISFPNLRHMDKNDVFFVTHGH